jgi:ATP phosphoribosyltransferase regulatory subunit
MATLLPAAAAVRQRLERTALDAFKSWGYEEIITPLFEYMDVITPGLGPGLVEKVYTVADRSSGRVMVLRPDITPQIARMAATVLRGAQRPLRLCYGANVFRYEDEHAGHEREIFQLGAELIGPSAPSADAEVLALAVDVLDRFGLSGATVAVGHVGFFRGWLAAADASPELAQQLEDAVAKKERNRVVDLLTGGGHTRAAATRLAGLLDLMGPESVLTRALSVVDSALTRDAVASLRETARQAHHYGMAKSLVFDLAEIRGQEYYSGLIFELFADGVGYEVGRGGRYDDLIGRYGSPEPSTGFAIHLERLQQGLDRTRTRPSATSVQALVLANGGSRGAIRLARELRGAGLSVAMWNEDGRAPEEYARAVRIPWMVAPGPARNSVTLTSTQSGRSRRLSVAACATLLSRRRPQE